MVTAMQAILLRMYGPPSAACRNNLAPMHPTGVDWFSDEILMSIAVERMKRVSGSSFSAVHDAAFPPGVQRIWLRPPFQGSRTSLSCEDVRAAQDVHMERATRVAGNLKTMLDCVFRSNRRVLKWIYQYDSGWVEARWRSK